MNRRNVFMLCAVACATLTSCFKEEPLNAECDITEAYIHSDNPSEIFFQPSDSIVKVLYSENTITFKVRSKADLTRMAPMFRTTDGATVVPASGSEHDFSKGPVTYTVTSEDRQWHRQYTVAIEVQTQTVSDTIRYDFEHFALNDKKQYYVWTEEGEDGDIWATGNPGFQLSKGTAKPDEYPTVPLTDGGYDGDAAKLVTSDTGPWGAMVNMRLAAGNLFTGRFDVTKALTNTMKATQFGLPFTNNKKPVKFSGFYKYTPGKTFQDRKGNPVDGRQDKADIYAVLYRNTDSRGRSVMLYGDDVQTNPNIVAMARVSTNGIGPTPQWTEFDAEFVYTGEFSQEVLDNRGYNLALVFTSSKTGATFEGAIGSTLCVDKVRIVCETKE